MLTYDYSDSDTHKLQRTVSKPLIYRDLQYWWRFFILLHHAKLSLRNSASLLLNENIFALSEQMTSENEKRAFVCCAPSQSRDELLILWYTSPLWSLCQSRAPLRALLCLWDFIEQAECGCLSAVLPIL
ncbi:hypothetical protein FGO68_gene16712 [Halteria grandinella]|uniref:Uncharacterized protein n=1 Tax=Halteria grandinella TaxID=5974 RepID=A0A8J8SUA3_HALGN|nr:hypothetical protein FGO68_gene16712 [Halteria grandinella]